MRSIVASPLRRSSGALRGCTQPSWIGSCNLRRWMTTDDRFEAGDTVLLRLKTKPNLTGLLLWPLRESKKIYLKEGILDHNDIIGKRVRDVVATHKGKEFLIHDPSLEEYLHLTPRTCTPIYAADANLIVSLLDIHIRPASDADAPSYAILEAGTGHGSLTLHLARAIHAANVPSYPRNRNYDSDSASETSEQEQGGRQTPRAILHTIDNNKKRSKDAQKVVEWFRRGLYSDNVQFHCGSVQDFLRGPTDDVSTASTPKLMYNHIILDLPDSYREMALAASRLKVDGCLLLWVPSITQLLTAVQLVRNEGLPLFLDRVVEVGQGMSGGRLWDVRSTRIRQFDRQAKALQPADEGRDELLELTDDSQTFKASDEEQGDAHGDDPAVASVDTEIVGEAIVCRPKVGERTIGGGFIGLWRRKRHHEQDR